MNNLEKEIQLLIKEYNECQSFEGIDAYMVYKHEQLIQRYNINRTNYFGLYNSMFMGDYSLGDC